MNGIWERTYNGFSNVDLQGVEGDGYANGVYVRAISFNSKKEGVLLLLENDGTVKVGEEFLLHLNAWSDDSKEKARMVLKVKLLTECTEEDFAEAEVTVVQQWQEL